MKSRFLEQWISDYLAERRVRANSLIITVYGDFIAPHGGTVWLGSFIRLVEPLGLNERMVRTSVYRLSQDNWLESEQIGRKSYYSLTTSGRRRFEHAYRRIYDTPQDIWNGEWQLVVLPSTLGSPERDMLRKELSWAGYGNVAPGVMGHPSTDTATLMEILQDTGTHDKAVPMQAATIGALSTKPLRDLARDCWNLDEIEATYREFSDRMRPVLRSLRSTRTLDPEQCFLIQTLTMHEFRRALLHDPQLPAQLMPQDWSGTSARALSRAIYQITWRHAQQHLMAVCETPTGPLPAAAPYYYKRFGGLEAEPTEDALAEN
ncbi:phenylacetic acid degradation operon negative regulatory protein PaaX [Aromatoleum petrolei]|uniref:Phenylacetic acid degradation operon negative regulatory protein PaaX n=1 Tax=Aromatoleum petrolei TaxID=76116 RepID=A0ABX1MQ45_9RHOO|nr:phenylacetic acid degradation operon negative regulatory protein PaaX [Aromatoleum petrolei]NMF88244.1 phenylacetic acid degradation operon negative regulatory protein PaaX [Aromatoleum petrolei]QTQ38054.1 Phenylacetic acid degradation operon negative regulatory protein [Aromatoleum petrolei]